jgi:hypothetical protein
MRQVCRIDCGGEVLIIVDLAAESSGSGWWIQPEANVIGLWDVEVGEDLQGSLPMLAGGERLAGCVVEVTDSVQGTSLLEPVTKLSGERKG